MSAPCSDWCRPDEGVHVMVDARKAPAALLQHLVGGTSTIHHAGECAGPIGTRVRNVAIEDASPEMPPPDGWPRETYPYLTLETVQVLDRHEHEHVRVTR